MFPHCLQYHKLSCSEWKVSWSMSWKNCSARGGWNVPYQKGRVRFFLGAQENHVLVNTRLPGMLSFCLYFWSNGRSLRFFVWYLGIEPILPRQCLTWKKKVPTIVGGEMAKTLCFRERSPATSTFFLRKWFFKPLGTHTRFGPIAGRGEAAVFYRLFTKHPVA